MSYVDSYLSPAEWYTLVARVRERAKGQCELCGRPDDGSVKFDTHHINHLARRGRTTIANLVFACRPCHQARHRHHLGDRSVFGGPKSERATFMRNTPSVRIKIARAARRRR